MHRCRFCMAQQLLTAAAGMGASKPALDMQQVARKPHSVCAKKGSLSHRWDGPLEQIGGVQQDAVASQADHEINVHVQPAGSSSTT